MSFESLRATPSGLASPASHPNKQGQKEHVRTESVLKTDQYTYHLPNFLNCLGNTFFGNTVPKMFINAGGRETVSLALSIHK